MDPVSLTKQAGVEPTGTVRKEGAGDASGVEQAPTHSTPEREEARLDALSGSSPHIEERVRSEMVKLFKGTNLEFEFERDENRVILRVFDKESGRLLREIPPTEAVTLSRTSRHGKGRLFSRAV